VVEWFVSIFYVGLIPVNLSDQVSKATKDAVENSYALIYESPASPEDDHVIEKRIEERLNKNNINFSGLLIPYGSHIHTNEEIYKIDRIIIDMLNEGKNVFITSDDGTVGVCDPGNSLINLVAETNHMIKIVPQTSAVLSAYLLSGITGRNCGSFFFGGILDMYDPETLNKYHSGSLIQTAINNNNSISIYLVNNLTSDVVKSAIKSIYKNKTRVALCADIGMDTQRVIISDTDRMFDAIERKDYKFVTLVIGG
jgi:16S rRNA C1402 (ribose-2'-O) methylase RsmI